MKVPKHTWDPCSHLVTETGNWLILIEVPVGKTASRRNNLWFDCIKRQQLKCHTHSPPNHSPFSLFFSFFPPPPFTLFFSYFPSPFLSLLFSLPPYFLSLLFFVLYFFLPYLSLSHSKRLSFYFFMSLSLCCFSFPIFLSLTYFLCLSFSF